MQKQPINNELLLFRQIAEGDERAFREVVHYYHDPLLSFVFHITKTRHTAEEIVQEVFLRLWLTRKELQMNNPTGWLYSVAANLAYTFIKRAAMEHKLIRILENSRLGITENTAETLQYRESVSLIAEALGKLPPQQQLIYRLSNHNGLTREQIAERLDLSPNTVKNHLTRAVQSIRDHIRKANFLLFFM